MRIKKSQQHEPYFFIELSIVHEFPYTTLFLFSHFYKKPCSHDSHLLALGEPMLQLHRDIAHCSCLIATASGQQEGGVIQA